MVVNDNIYGTVIGPYNLENKNILNYFQLYHDTSIQENSYFSLANVLNIIENKFYLLNSLLVIFSCLGIITFLKSKKNKKFSLVLLTILLLQIILFGFKNWSGFNLGYSVGDSFTRYVLISWCILLFYCLYFFDKIRWKAKRIVLPMFLVYFLITNIYLMSMTPFGYYGWRDVSRWTYKYDKPFFNSSPKTILFTGLYEKYLYPSVTPAIYTAFPKEYRAEKTADLMNKLLEDGYSVYFMYDTVPELDFGRNYYFNTFTQKNLSFELVKKIYNKQDLYKIIQK
jgi:hypothetical protein